MTAGYERQARTAGRTAGERRAERRAERFGLRVSEWVSLRVNERGLSLKELCSFKSAV